MQAKQTGVAVSHCLPFLPATACSTSKAKAAKLGPGQGTAQSLHEPAVSRKKGLLPGLGKQVGACFNLFLLVFPLAKASTQVHERSSCRHTDVYVHTCTAAAKPIQGSTCSLIHAYSHTPMH